MQVAELFTDNFDYQTKNDFVRGILVNEEVWKTESSDLLIYEFVYDLIKGFFFHRSWETRSTCMSLKMDMGLVCLTSWCTTQSLPTWSDAGSIRSRLRPTLQTKKARAVHTLDIMCTVSQGSVWVTAARWRKMCLLAEIQWLEQTAPYQILSLEQTVSSVLSL